MAETLCIVHANCQGEPLVRMLNQSAEFRAEFRVESFVNYTREPIPERSLACCGLFLHQHLDEKWGELSSEALFSRLPRGCPSLCIPNLFFKGYWPLWSGAPGFDYRDVFLDRLLDMGLAKPEILHLYLKTDLAAKYDLQALAEASLDHERNKEARTPIKYMDLILERFRTERLFNTVNHPGRRLMRHVALGVLKHLGLKPPQDFDSEAGVFPDIELPIHPRVAGFFGLSFAGPDTVYNVHGRKKTFAQYAEAYVDCRLSNIEDFIAYLGLR
ncbi:MAG: hypothetical protein JW718_05825 [Desulfovibrionaceae bacterium]|nr:hypothetical protein [Desulfovibrionaceae bacterium]